MFIMIDKENETVSIFETEEELAESVNELNLVLEWDKSNQTEDILRYYNMYHSYGDFKYGYEYLEEYFDIVVIPNAEFGEMLEYGSTRNI